MPGFLHSLSHFLSKLWNQENSLICIEVTLTLQYSAIPKLIESLEVTKNGGLAHPYCLGRGGAAFRNELFLPEQIPFFLI